MERNTATFTIICLFVALVFCIVYTSLYPPHSPLVRVARQPQDFSARVTWIEDGDTITVVSEGWSRVLRLYLIDAPEKGEPYSRRATDYLRHRILNEIVQVQDVCRMNHGRLLAFVSFDGELINLALLREGLAYLAIYHPEEEVYRSQAEAAVKEAQKNKRGVWR